MTVQALLLGGPKNGEVMALPSARQSFDVYLPEPVSFATAALDPLGPTYQTRRYLLERAGRDWAVYRFEVTPADVRRAADRLAAAVEVSAATSRNPIPSSVWAAAVEYRQATR